jgi:putative superfamily III holin-X
MDCEKTMNTNGRARAEQPNVATSFSELTHDAIELAELQAQLFALDVKETTQSTKTSLILTIVGSCLLLASLPVALIALAELLVEQLEWSRSAGYGVATLVGIVVSAGILATAYARFRSGLGTLKRSREELRRNIDWIKSSLRSRATSSPTVKNN